MNNYNIAKDLGEMQYNLIFLELQSLSEVEKHIKMQHYFNEFKAIIKVSNEHADIIQSKYMPLLLAYQQLFNLKGGCVPRLSLSQFTNLSHNNIDSSLSHNSENK